MTIALCTDERYAMPCGACIASIYENNTDNDYNVAVVYRNLSDGAQEKLKTIAVNYGRDLIFRQIDESLLVNLKVSDRFPESIYYRFLLPNLFPEEKKILYLDCDIIVNDNLNDLFAEDISDFAIGAVVDQCADDITNTNRIEIETTYFNSGVLMINVDYWLKNKIAEVCSNFISKYPERCLYPDQDALNYVLRNKVKYLSCKWNFQELMYQEKKNLYLSRSKWAEIDENREGPVVIHYTSYIKPWYLESKHPLKSTFVHYQMKTPWNDYELKEYWPEPTLMECVKRVGYLIKCILLKLVSHS